MLTVDPPQIKNMVAATYALAVFENTKVSMSHLETVTGLNEVFESDFGKDSNKHFLPLASAVANTILNG